MLRNMKYAKLINNFPVYAPNPIKHDGLWYGNPPAEVYTAEGYKPVRFTDPPTEPTEGYQWSETWSETAEEIVQGWVLVEKIDVDPAEVIDYLFGGDSE